MGTVRITAAQLRQFMPQAPADAISEIVETQSVLAEFGISQNAESLAMFFANLAHESRQLNITEENLNYSAQRMTEVWPTRFRTVAAAQPYARNPQALANNVYANRMGNGPSSSGDGWKYRGRGWAQHTGKDGYMNVGRFAGLDLVRNPELVNQRGNRLRCAAGFWAWKNLSTVANRSGSLQSRFDEVVRRWNGGHIGMADRRRYLAAALGAFRDAARSGPIVLGMGSQGPEVGELQRALKDKRYRIGLVDDKFGNLTRNALLAWQADNGRPSVPSARYPEDVQAIRASQPMRLSEEREEATAADLAGKSRIVDDTGAIIKTGVGVGTAVGGAKAVQQAEHVGVVPPSAPSTGPLDGIGSIVDRVEQPVGLFNRITWMAQDFGLDLAGFVADHALLIVGGAVAVTVYFAYKARAARVQDHNEGHTL